MSSTNKNVRAKTSQMANELWPLVQDEKRIDGTPVFSDRNGLISHLSYAFPDKRIGGAQSGRNSSIWVDKDATLNYITKYVELAKTTKNVAWNANSTALKIRALQSGHSLDKGKPSKASFILVDKDGVTRRVSAHSAKDAAFAVLMADGSRLYKIDGNRLSLAGKLDPWDK